MPRSQKPRKRHNRTKTAAQDLSRPPHMWQVWRTFEPLYQLFDSLRDGEIDAVGGVPVMPIWGRGEVMEVPPVLDGWVCCWERIVAGEGLPIDLSPLRQMQRYLANGVMMTSELLRRARAVTDQCYRAYAAMPRERAISYTRTEQIAIELESLGIVPAAGRVAA
ncbi:hypothetical protein [Sphingopyxis sp.]|uniref:hypothetical protein n=1 Tax=Sphingopyxis sp. TaxID=1908224 RepID=UPI0025CD0BFC|nr:hypothetical protein [Sphingopyxis sp.]MBK6414045.1 hypothetical protein [Sphingopyxis sp.]